MQDFDHQHTDPLMLKLFEELETTTDGDRLGWLCDRIASYGDAAVPYLAGMVAGAEWNRRDLLRALTVINYRNFRRRLSDDYASSLALFVKDSYQHVKLWAYVEMVATAYEKLTGEKLEEYEHKKAALSQEQKKSCNTAVIILCVILVVFNLLIRCS